MKEMMAEAKAKREEAKALKTDDEQQIEEPKADPAKDIFGESDLPGAKEA